MLSCLGGRLKELEDLVPEGGCVAVALPVSSAGCPGSGVEDVASCVRDSVVCWARCRWRRARSGSLDGVRKEGFCRVLREFSPF